MAADQSDLTTVANVKAYLSPSTGSTDDALIQRLVTEVSAACARYCSVTFQAAQYIENRNGTGQRVLRVRQATKVMPMYNLSAVTIDTYSVPLSPSPLSGGYTNDEIFIYLRGQLSFVLTPLFFTRGYQNVQITYWSGFKTAGQVSLGTTFPAGVNPPTQPFDLEQVAVEMCVAAIRRRSRIGDTGTSVGGVHASYMMAEMPDSAKSALQRYMNVGLSVAGD